MPTYEFRCTACGHTFETLTPTMAAPKDLSCPQCGGTELRRLLSSFFAHSAQEASAKVPEACQQCNDRANPSCPFAGQG